MMQCSNALRKAIRSLHAAKGRREENAFIVEGTKAVADMLPYFACRWLVALPKWLADHGDIAGRVGQQQVVQATPADMERLTTLSTPPEVLAVMQMPAAEEFDPAIAQRELVLACADVQDPGNMGTIIRTALWYGVKHFLLSPGTVSLYNPKTVQATMGALAHIHAYRMPLEQALSQMRALDVPVYGSYLHDATDLYAATLTQHGVIIVGNEGNGIPPALESAVSNRIYIPPTGPGPFPESLNVSAATAIILSRFRHP